MRIRKTRTRPLSVPPVAETEDIRIPSDILMSLDFIDAGCLPLPIADKIGFLLKESPEKIASLRRADKALLVFECIKREEFPAVKMTIQLDGSAETYAATLFFGIESDEEMEFLAALSRQNCFDILLFSSKPEYIRRVNLTEDDGAVMSAVLTEAAR